MSKKEKAKNLALVRFLNRLRSKHAKICHCTAPKLLKEGTRIGLSSVIAMLELTTTAPSVSMISIECAWFLDPAESLSLPPETESIGLTTLNQIGRSGAPRERWRFRCATTPNAFPCHFSLLRDLPAERHLYLAGRIAN